MQKGFNLVAVIVVATLVVAGAIVWRLGTTNNTSSQQAATQQPQANAPAGDIQQSRIVDIAEWGVKFTSVDGLENVLYAKRPLVSVFGVNFAADTENIVLSTVNLASVSANCNVETSSHTGIGTLYRSPSELSQNEALVANIDGYFYYYFGPQSTCTQSAQHAQMELDAKNKLRQSLDSLERI